MKSIEEKVLRFIDSNKLILKNEKILIALSGGTDSVFTLYFLNKFKQRLGISISAAHLNHSLRGTEADRDEIFCEEYCKKLNIKLYTRKIPIESLSKKSKTSLEETGRVERYKYLSELTEEFHYDKIVTAHHKDDNAETVLLNLFRGTGIRGYSGIPIRRGNVIRPILILSKKEILNYLDKYKVPYITDVTNFSDMYSRNLIRNQIIPLIEREINPRWSDSVFASSQVVSSYLELIDKRFLSNLQKKLICEETDSLYFNLEVLKKNEGFLITELIRKTITEKFSIDLSYLEISRILELGLSEKTGKKVVLKAGVIVIKNQSDLEVYRAKEKVIVENRIKIGDTVQAGTKTITISISKKRKINLIKNKDNQVEYIDSALIKGDFELRYWKEGDYFYPLGMEQKKKISDFLTDSKVASSRKKNVLVLVNKGRIVWVVGYRISNLFRLNEETKNILRLQLG
jgi:tRNA(Ile)-lysidine synthase